MKMLIPCLLLVGFLGCERNRVEADCVEKPNSTIACTQQYDPVCGCNDKTYGNACMASAVGIRVVAKGECGNRQ